MNSTAEQNSIALFIDMENLIRSAMGIGLPVDLGPIVSKLLELGRLSVRRGYGDLDAACRGDWKLREDMRRMIHLNLVQFEDIPYVTKFKNTADMRLAVDALSTAYTYPNIGHFAIVAADRDYVPLIAKLKELGRRIIGIGVSPDTVHEIYLNSCDVFLYYSAMFSVTGQPAQPLVEDNDASLVQDFIRLLLQAVSATVQKGLKPVGAVIVPLMRQLRPDFDPALAKLASFRELAELAEQRNLVSLSQSGGDILINLGKATGNIAVSSSSISRLDHDDHAGAKVKYLGFLEEKMKCPLPSLDVRGKIYDEASRHITARGLLAQRRDLQTISEEVWRSLGEERSGLVQPMVYKVLYALFRAGAFDARPTESPYNPEIQGIALPVDRWDSLFVKNSLLVISRERRTWPLLHQPLAELFEMTPTEIALLTDEIEE